MRVHSDYPLRNLAAQKADQGSLFQLARRLIALRQIHPALQRGGFVPLAATRNVRAYQRTLPNETLTILLNFARGTTDFDLRTPGRVILSTDRSEGTASGRIPLRPREVCILKSQEA